MPIKIRGKRAAYDNIAAGEKVGGPSGGSMGERTISGDTVSPVEMPGGGFRTSTSTGEAWHTNVKVGTSTTDDLADGTVAGGAQAENLISGQTSNTDEKLG